MTTGDGRVNNDLFGDGSPRWMVAVAAHSPGAARGPIRLDLAALGRENAGFDHHVWLTPCASADDAKNIWRAFGFEPTENRVSRLLEMRDPEYLHHNNVTDEVQLVNVNEVDVDQLPSGHLITGCPGEAPR